MPIVRPLPSAAAVFSATALLAMLAFAAPAAASDGCDFQSFNHNGSRMDYENCGGPLAILYNQPRSALKRHGVRSGTVLFEGSITRSGRISGTAYRFKSGCRPIGYAVSGRYSDGGFTLSGTAPIRGSGCTVTRYKKDRLRFD